MFRTAAAFITLVSIVAPALSAPINLAPTFEVGRTMRYRYASQTEQVFFLQGQPQGSGASRSDTQASITVESVSDDGAVLSVVFDGAVIDFEGAGLDIAFDSSLPPEKDPDSPVAPAFRSFLGKPVRCIVTPAGKLVRVEGSSELAPKEDPARRLALQYLAEPNLRWLIETAFVAKTDPPTASVGESWDASRVEPHLLGTLQVEQTMTLDADDAGIAKISIKGTDRVQKLLGVGARPGSETVEHLPAQIIGTLRWDTHRGQADRFELVTRSVDIEQHAQHGEIRKQMMQTIIVERLN